MRYFSGHTHTATAVRASLPSHGEKLMDMDTGSYMTFTVSLGVQERSFKIVSSHFDFITNQNTSHSMAPQVHRIITLGGRGGTPEVSVQL